MPYVVRFRILDERHTEEHPLPVSYAVVQVQDVDCTTDRSGRCTVIVDQAGEFPVKFRHANYRPTLSPPYITIPTSEEYILKATPARF
jgi:hypothetical protein